MQVITTAWLLSAAAWAGPVEDGVEGALSAIQDGDVDAARAQLDAANAAAGAATSVVDGTTLARIAYYLGILEYYDGDRESASLDYWRATLARDGAFQWDTSLVVEEEPQMIFENLRLELESRSPIGVGVPENTQGMVVYVDGRVIQPGGTVAPGDHLLQVVCPDQVVHTQWNDLSATVDFEAICPDAFVEIEDPDTKERGDSSLNLVLWGTGGALLAGGTAANFLWVNPLFDQIDTAREAPASITRDEANALTDDFNTARYVTMGLLGAGIATTTAGFFVHDVTLAPTGRGVLLSGRF